jgi:hypothetical protein
MDMPFIAGRASLSDAQTLIREYGGQAALQAAELAERSREADNIRKFCHWRQIERLIDTLSSGEARGTIH